MKTAGPIWASTGRTGGQWSLGTSRHCWSSLDSTSSSAVSILLRWASYFWMNLSQDVEIPAVLKTLRFFRCFWAFSLDVFSFSPFFFNPNRKSCWQLWTCRSLRNWKLVGSEVESSAIRSSRSTTSLWSHTNSSRRSPTTAWSSTTRYALSVSHGTQRFVHIPPGENGHYFCSTM